MKTLKYCLLFICLMLPLQSQAATDYRASMTDLLLRGDQLVSEYDPARAVHFGNQFSQLYFGHFEGQGLEFAVGQADNDAMLAIEISFSRLINSAVTGKPAVQVNEQWQALRLQLVAAPLLESANASFTELVVQSLLILLREGIEALLVIAALIAYLRKAGAADRVALIWWGALAALGASVLTAIALNKLIQNSGAARETLEGVTMLIAAVLLSYVSVWLFARREMQQWQGFIQDRLGSAVSGGSLWAIVSVAFFAVYREGAETILFYQALVSDAEGQWQAIATGFGLATAALLVVYFMIFQLSVRLPLKQFFTGTAALLYLMSVVFAGKAVLELQVAGWLGNHYLSAMPTISWMGLFPSIEGIVAQLLMLTLPVLGWVLISARRRTAATIPA